MDIQLSSRTALILGGSSGIGKGIEAIPAMKQKGYGRVLLVTSSSARANSQPHRF